MKAIHLICRREGKDLIGLTHEGGRIYRSCCWAVSEGDAGSLIGGWIYLHSAKAMKSEFGGAVLAVESVSWGEALAQTRYAIRFEARKEGRDRPWRGSNHGMAWTGGVVDGSFDHELNSD